MITYVVNRAWPGVTNGQKIELSDERAQRLLAMGMISAWTSPAEMPVPKRGKARKSVQEATDVFLPNLRS